MWHEGLGGRSEQRKSVDFLTYYCFTVDSSYLSAHQPLTHHLPRFVQFCFFSMSLPSTTKKIGLLHLFAQSRQSDKLFLQSSELGLPHPSPAGECAPPLVLGREHTRWQERGWESPNSDEGQHNLCTLWLIVFSSLLFYNQNIPAIPIL